ncbi:hypothetical protein AB2M62_07415 [Sphingomonas sp. MMS12-HWE2-04]|uniref:hypothetical protein n=1 Tax=Sphingomonas sp. MMS12-HWE2-04 TaxID=3234199 RepID=UPI00384F052C
MPDRIVNGVRVRVQSTWLGGQTIVIPRQQLANGQRIPELHVKIKQSSRLYNGNVDLQILTKFLSARTIGGNGTLTDTAIFFNDAYDRNLTGAIRFTDLSGKAAGEFSVFNFGSSTVTNVPFVNDFAVNIDVPKLQEAAAQRYTQLASWQRYVNQGNPSTLMINGVPFAQNVNSPNIALARANTLLDVFAEVAHHEFGGHGLHVNLQHGALNSANDFLNDYAYSSGFTSQYLTGGITVDGQFGSWNGSQWVGSPVDFLTAM